jgi:hypothetical protein
MKSEMVRPDFLASLYRTFFSSLLTRKVMMCGTGSFVVLAITRPLAVFDMFQLPRLQQCIGIESGEPLDF